MISNLLFENDNLCLNCAKELRYKHFLCKSCLERLNKLSIRLEMDYFSIDAIYLYDGLMKKMMASYKFNEQSYYAKVFSSIFEEYISNNSDFDLLLPVALHPKKKRFRGFDHLRLITDPVCRKYDLQYVKSFRKTKHTTDQHLKSLNERKDNLKGVFDIDQDEIINKSLLIFDDIITTGNTIKEVAQTVRKKGAKKVKAVALTSLIQCQDDIS